MPNVNTLMCCGMSVHSFYTERMLWEILVIHMHSSTKVTAQTLKSTCLQCTVNWCFFLLILLFWLGLTAPAQGIKRALPSVFLLQQTFSVADTRDWQSKKTYHSFWTVIAKSKEMFLAQNTKVVDNPDFESTDDENSKNESGIVPLLKDRNDGTQQPSSTRPWKAKDDNVLYLSPKQNWGRPSTSKVY